MLELRTTRLRYLKSTASARIGCTWGKYSFVTKEDHAWVLPVGNNMSELITDICVSYLVALVEELDREFDDPWGRMGAHHQQMREATYARDIRSFIERQPNVKAMMRDAHAYRMMLANQTKITCVGRVDIPQQVTLNADAIKLEHYKVNSPHKFQVHKLGDAALMQQLSELIELPSTKLDYVYFSACRGAEPHTDILDPVRFTNDTYVIPVILPNGISTITAQGFTAPIEVGSVYKFDHTQLHSMELEDNESGCVVIMVAVLKEPNE